MNVLHSIEINHGMSFAKLLNIHKKKNLKIKTRCATTADYDRDKKWGNCVQVKCYKLVEDEKEYFEARSACNVEQATLATINNENEQG